ncbi:MAG: hypothetical protein R3B91_00930 [Planctomycetaceae bacterium]
MINVPDNADDHLGLAAEAYEEEPDIRGGKFLSRICCRAPGTGEVPPDAERMFASAPILATDVSPPRHSHVGRFNLFVD